MKYMLIVAAILLLAGCERTTDAEQAVYYSEHGKYLVDRMGELCKNGVVYYFSTYDRGPIFTAAFNPDSTVKTCK